MLETASVCLLIHLRKLYSLCSLFQSVASPLSTYSTKMYKMVSFPQENVQSDVQMFPQCLSLASKASFRTRKCCMQLITSHDNKDCDVKTIEMCSLIWTTH